MPRRTRRVPPARAAAWVLNTLLVALAVLAALIGVRLPLAEEVARSLARTQGLGELELTVSVLHPQRIVVRDAAVPARGWRARRIALTLDPVGAPTHLLRRVDIDGLDATLDLTERSANTELAAATGGAPKTTAEAGGIDLPLPSISLHDATIRVRHPGADATLRLQGRLDRRSDGNVQGALRGSAETRAGTLEVSLAGADLAGTPTLDVEIDGPVDVAALPWPAAWPVRATAGTADLRLTVDGELPPLSEISGLRDLAEGTAKASLRIDASGLRLPPYAKDAAVATTLRVDLRRTAAVLGLTEPLRVTAAELNGDALERLGLSPDAARFAASAETLILAPWTPGGELLELRRDGETRRLNARGTLRVQTRDGGRARLRAAVQGQPGLNGGAAELSAEPLALRLRDITAAGQELATADFEGRAAWGADGLVLPGTLTAKLAALNLDGRAYSDLSADLPIRLTYNDDRLELRTTDSGRIRHPDPVDLGGARLESLDVELARLRLRQNAGGWTGAATLDPGTLRLAADGGPANGARVTPGPVQLELRPDGAESGLRVRVDDARARLPALDLRAAGIAAELQSGGDSEPMGTLEIGRFADGESPARFAPLGLRAVLRRAAGQLIAAGTLRVLDHGVSASFAGRHDLAEGSGMLRVSETRLSFTPGELQPAVLSPVLDRLSRVRGEVTLETALRWADGAVETPASMTLDDLAFETPAASVEGLSGEIRMTRLSPPLSEPEQTVTAERLVAGVPLTDVRASFRVSQMADGSGTSLAIKRARGSLAEGEVFVRDTSYRLGAPENAVTVRVSGLSLKALLEQLDLKGVSGEGRISGAIPVTIADSGVTVADGQLAAETGGVLRVDLAETGEALKQQSRPVRLMVRAMQDLRYDSLALTVNRSLDEGLSLKVNLEGKNPAVLDGYPFAFNVTLTGEVEPILLALQEGRQLTTDLLQRALEADSESP